MAAPVRDRPQWIPFPPLPEFYTNTEGGTKASSKSKSEEPKEENLPPPKLDPSTMQASIPTSATPPGPFAQYPGAGIDATGRLEAPKNFPPLPPPPPGVTTVEASGMAYHYTHHYHHAGHPYSKVTHAYNSYKPPAAPVVAVPHPPPTYEPWAATIPPANVRHAQLATYHVCRICFSPRSEKYHLQNPIPAGGVPPPPEICRRCRVKNLEDRSVRVETIRESSPIKIGVACLVADEDHVTKAKVRDETIETRADSRPRDKGVEKEPGRSREVSYRYVRVKETSTGPPPAQPAEVSVENLATMNLMNERQSAKTSSEKTTTKQYSVQPGEPAKSIPIPGLSTATSLRATKVEKVDNPQASMSAKGSVSAAREQESTKVIEVETRNKAATSSSRGSKSSHTLRPGHTESEIRKIAREEVERYRHAERLMTAHPHAYSHGRPVEVDRTVPIERRIELESDVNQAKPWEVPEVPVVEAVPSIARSAKAPSATKSEHEPSEDSRFWYHQPESNRGSTRASAWAGSDRPATERGRRSERTFEREIEVVVEEDVFKPAHKEIGARPTERHEVIEVIRVAPHSDAHSRAGSHRHGSTKSAVSGRPMVSSRVQELRGQVDQRDRQSYLEPAATSNVAASVMSSLRTDRDFWEQGAPVKVASRVSSVRQESYVQPSEHETVEMPSPRQYIRVERPRAPAPSDGIWYADRVERVGTQQAQSERSSRRQQDDDEKTVWPGEEPTRPAASERTSTVKGDWDWEYTERTVQPVDRPLGSRPFDEQPPRWRSESERLVSRSYVPAPSPQSTVVSQAPEPKPESQFLAQPDATASTKKSPPTRGRGPYMQRFSDESVHVRFASKVEFSPTPPGSDEYMPEQAPQRRDQRREERRSGLRYQVDGPDEKESAQDLINEYGVRRARSHAPASASKDDEFDFVYERGSTSEHHEGNARLEMHGAVPEGREQRRSSLRGGGFKRGPLNDADEDNERRSALSPHSTVASRRTFTGRTETATQLSESRPLTHALSESPSREKLRQDYLRQERGNMSEKNEAQDERSEYQLRGRSDTLVRDDFDDEGPYRIEERSESMDASYGSGHGGPSMRREPSRRRSVFAVRERR